MSFIKPKRQIWTPSKPAILVPRRRTIPVVRPPIIPMRRIIPITATLGIDGTPAVGSWSSGTSFSSATFTTSLVHDVIIAQVFTESLSTVTTTSNVTATGLSFTKRTSQTTSALSELSYWWAPAASTFSGTVTVTLSQAPDDAIVIVWAVSGANYTSPWDTNASLPKYATGTTNVAPSVSGVSTTNANDMLIGICGVENLVLTQTAGAMGGTTGTLIQTTNGTGAANTTAAEDRVVSATQSSISVAFGTASSGAHTWQIFADAIVAASAAATTIGWSRPSDSDRFRVPSPQADETRSFFRPSPNPVPQNWLPTTGMEDRPPEPNKRPDDSSIEEPQFYQPSQHPVPTRWLPLTGEEDRLPNQNRVPSPDTFPWFVQSSNPVPRTWLPLTGEEDRPPNTNRILAPDQPFPWFVRSPNPVPARWLPQWDGGEHPKRIDPDPSGSVFVRFPVSAAVGISGIAWYNPGEDIGERPPPVWPRPINRFFSVQISTSTIAGMAWNNPAEDRERLPPIRRSPDEGTPFFVRSPNPVPIIWLPQWDGGEHPRRIDLDPSPIAFVRFPVAAAVPISGIAWYNPGEDIGERPPPVWPRPTNKFFSVQVQTSVQISGMAWYAPYADRERPPRAPPDASLTAFSFKAPPVVGISGIAWFNPPETRLPPIIGDPYAVQDLPFFIEPPLQQFYAAANADDFNPLKPLFSASDGSVLPFRFIATPVGISGISWWRPVEVFVGPPPPTAEFGTQWRISQPPPPVGIAGISWWRQTEVYVGPPPPQLDYTVSWNPQFIFTPTNVLLLRTLMGMGQ